MEEGCNKCDNAYGTHRHLCSVEVIKTQKIDPWIQDAIETWGINEFRRKMLDELVKDYSAYLKLDVLNGFQTVQDVVDNMLTRLEELTSVLQMIKLKNSDCGAAVADDIIKYRSEITVLSKKITTLSKVILTLHHNVDVLEKQVDKAEGDFGVNNDNKITSFLKPFLKKNRSNGPTTTGTMLFDKMDFESLMNNFE